MLIISHDFRFKACQTAHELRLFGEFTIYDFVFPLILQDKLSTAEAFMLQAIDLQRPLIVLLDSLLDRASTIQQIVDQFVG